MQNVTTPPPSTADQECDQYLPLKDLFEKMAQTKEANPYSSTFSFIPFIEKMKEKMDEVLTKRLPEFPKEVQLKLPKLQLPKLKKVEA